MERFEAEQIIASYSLGEDPFATLPPAASVLVGPKVAKGEKTAK